MILSPVRGDFEITQGFGENPQVYKKFGLKSHNGQDLALPVGTPLYSPIDGRILIKKEQPKGYGKYCYITEQYNGECREIILAHLDRFANWTDGDWIKAGDLVGWSGNTGFSTGPHLHWGLRRRINGGVKNYENGYFGYEDIFGKGWISKNEPSKY